MGQGRGHWGLSVMKPGAKTGWGFDAQVHLAGGRTAEGTAQAHHRCKNSIIDTLSKAKIRLMSGEKGTREGI